MLSSLVRSQPNHIVSNQQDLVRGQAYKTVTGAATMSKTECENWFAECFPKGTPPETVDKINRGPMKGVLEFLIKRAKPSNAIEVIRSNLYIHRKYSIDAPVEDGRREEKIKIYEELKKSESILLNSIEENNLQLYALDTTASSFTATMEKKHLINTMRENLTIIGSFLADVSEIKSKGSITAAERLKTLNELLEDALKIFQDIFFRRGGYEPNELDWSKIDKIIPSILCSQDYGGDIQRWNSLHRQQSEQKIYKRLEEISKTIQPNPLAEWDSLVTKKLFMWTQCHVQLHWKNARFVDIYKSICAKKREGQLRAMVTARRFRSFPPDFFSLLLRREELKCQLRRCREMSNLRTIDLWEGNSLEMESDSYLDNSGMDLRDRQRPSSKSTLYKNGATEDMAVCLLKGWYSTKTRLFVTQERVRQIIPDNLFPAINALLNHTQTTFSYSSINESGTQGAQSSRGDTIRDFSLVTPKETETRTKFFPHQSFPSTNLDLNPIISMEEELKCQSLKRGSSTSDVLINLLDTSISMSNSL